MTSCLIQCKPQIVCSGYDEPFYRKKSCVHTPSISSVITDRRSSSRGHIAVCQVWMPAGRRSHYNLCELQVSDGRNVCYTEWLNLTSVIICVLVVRTFPPLSQLRASNELHVVTWVCVSVCVCILVLMTMWGHESVTGLLAMWGQYQVSKREPSKHKPNRPRVFWSCQSVCVCSVAPPMFLAGGAFMAHTHLFQI